MSRFDVFGGMRSRRGADARTHDVLQSAEHDDVLGPVLSGVRALSSGAAPDPQGDLLVMLTEGFTPPPPTPLAPRRPVARTRRWFARLAVVTTPLTLKIAAVTTVAAAATVGGLAVTGSLPDGPQRWLSDAAATVNIQLPRPASDVPTSAVDAVVVPLSGAPADKTRADEDGQDPAAVIVPPSMRDDDHGDAAEDAADDRWDAREDAADEAEDDAEDRRDAQEDAADEADDAAEDAEDATDDRRDAQEDAAEDAEDAVDDHGDAQEDAADDAEDAVEDGVDADDDAADDAAEDADDAVEEQEDAADEAADKAEDDADDARDADEDASRETAEQAEDEADGSEDAADD